MAKGRCVLSHAMQQSMRLERLAATLLDGPEHLHPPRSQDRHGWLTRALGISVQLTTPIPGGAVFRDPRRSVAIYVDDTPNRTRGFLAPIIRYASWDRLADLPRLGEPTCSWPDVQVRLGTMHSRRVTLAFVARLQRQLRRLPFVPHFSSRRAAPSGPAGGAPGLMRIFVWNGDQAVEYNASTSGVDQRLASLAIAGLELLHSQMKPLRLRGRWECYKSSPSADAKYWTWHYRPEPPVAT